MYLYYSEHALMDWHFNKDNATSKEDMAKALNLNIVKDGELIVNNGTDTN